MPQPVERPALEPVGLEEPFAFLFLSLGVNEDGIDGEKLGPHIHSQTATLKP